MHTVVSCGGRESTVATIGGALGVVAVVWHSRELVRIPVRQWRVVDNLEWDRIRPALSDHIT